MGGAGYSSWSNLRAPIDLIDGDGSLGTEILLRAYGNQLSSKSNPYQI